MASSGVIGADYAHVHSRVNAPVHSTLGMACAHDSRMDYLSKNLRFYMRQNGYQETEAAKAIGVAQSTINRLVKPDSSKPIRNPSQATIRKIADAIGVSVDDVLRRDIEVSGPSVSPVQEGSHSERLDHRKLATSLVAVEKAITSLGLDPARSWGLLSRLVIWTLDLQDELYPLGIHSKADHLGFDAQVERELRNGGYGGVRKVEQVAGRSNEGRGKTSTTRKGVGGG